MVGVVPLISCIIDIIVGLSDGYFHCLPIFGRSIPADDIDSRHERLQEREREIICSTLKRDTDVLYCRYTRNCILMGGPINSN